MVKATEYPTLAMLGQIMAEWVTAVERLEEGIRKLENDVKAKGEMIGKLTLENQELAKRPVVYVRVVKGVRRESEGGYPLLYIPEELGIYPDPLQFEPYTGEQQ